MTDYPLRDRAAIVGVGATPYSKNSGVSTLTMALRAISAAVEDAGLTLDDIDGVACHRVNDSAPASIVAESIGKQDLHFFLDQFGGGSTSHAIVGAAAMAVATKQADCVVCWRAVNRALGVPHGWHRSPTARPARVPVPVPVRLCAPAAAVRDDRERVHDQLRRDVGGLRVGGDRATLVRGAQRARAHAHAADDGRLPRVAVDRRATAPVRLLPRDRRRDRGGDHVGRAGA